MKRKNAGFTLIELLTSLTLLSLVIFTFAPLVSFSLAQIATAGNYNSALHNAAGELEGAQAQILDDVAVGDTPNVTVADHVKTTDMKVVFQKDGVADSSGTKVEYATGTELQPTSTSNLLDDLLAFVGMKVEGSLSLNPPIIRVDDTFPLTVDVIPNGFTFRDQVTVNAKMKLIYTDASGNDQVVPGLTFTFVNENLVRFTLQQDTLIYDNSPYRLYYGSYFAYQPIELINFETLDLVVAGTDGKVAISTGSKNTSTNPYKDGTYDWVFESKSIDYLGKRTINDILWMPNEDPDQSRFVGVGDDGLYFEISEGLGLDFSFRATGFDSNIDESQATLKPSGDINQAIISPSDPTKIEVAGVFDLGGTDTAGQYTLPTSVSENSKAVTGVKSAGNAQSVNIWEYEWYVYPLWGDWNKDWDTVQEYERTSGKRWNNTDYKLGFSTEENDTNSPANMGVLMGNTAVATATGTLSNTAYTLTLCDNGRVIYYNHTTKKADTMVFSMREAEVYDIYRCTVPDSDSATVQPTSIAYGNGMFMLGMNDGRIFCITAPAATTGTYGGFGTLERSSDGNSIVSIIYDPDQMRWMAISENGSVLYRNSNDTTRTWHSLNPTINITKKKTFELSSVNLTEIKYIPASKNIAAEYFILGDDWTIVHVDATSDITNNANWKKDTVYSYYDADNPDNNVPIKPKKDGEMTFNTVARRLEG